MSRKVLVVDDSDINRKLLYKILCDDYEVLTAKDGKEALEILETSGDFISAVLLDIVIPVMDGFELLKHIHTDNTLSNIPVIVTTSITEKGTDVKALALGANDFIVSPYDPTIIKHKLRNTIKMRETAYMLNSERLDPLTGLYNRPTFFKKAEHLINSHKPGYYMMSCFDINNFKVINDQYGNDKGDDVLRFFADVFRKGFEPVGGICCRITADTFAVLYPKSFIDTEEIKKIHRAAVNYDGSIQPVSFSIGRYLVDDLSLSVAAMYDRASIAQESIKSRFDVDIAHYDEDMRQTILREQSIVNEMRSALKTDQFEVWLQPQYNHSSGALIGSEALVRWNHHTKGLIPPNDFIPIFERNGFIYEMDKYVWEQVCIFLREQINKNREPLPVSVNISRNDILYDDFTDILVGLLEKYSIPVDLLRLEITESAFAKGSERIISVINQLVDFGFTIEIDDFGSGYSSLNTLKDIPADILKLDMSFLKDSENSTRSGNILESIVRMAKWLGMPVIAEGVETKEQADHLLSIGCFYVQGFLYAKPMPIGEYEKLVCTSAKEAAMTALETVKTLDSNAFWDPASMETLIFNSYVGGACIFEYHEGNIEVLRANKKYAEELGENISMQAALTLSLEDYMDEQNISILHNSIKTAIETNEESPCEICLINLTDTHKCTYLRTAVRVIAKAGTRRLLYCSIINMTAQREAEQNERDTAEQLQAINEQKIISSSKQLHFLNDTAHELLAQEKAEMAFHEMLPFALKAMMASSADLSFVKDKELNYICCSREFAKMVGLKSENDIVGKSDYDFFDKALAEQYRCDDLKLMESGRSIIDQIEQIPSRDGTPRYSSTSKYLLYDNLDNAIGLYGVGRDITEKRKAYAKLDLLTTALSTVYPVIVSVNLTQNSYEIINNSEDFFLYNQGSKCFDDFIYAGAKRVLPEFARSFIEKFECASLLKSLSKENGSIHLQYRQLSYAGKKRWIEATAIRVNDNHNGDRMGIFLCRIIDEQKAVEDKLEHALTTTNEELARQNIYQNTLTTFMPLSSSIIRISDGKLLHIGGTLLQKFGYTEASFMKLYENHLRGFVIEEDYDTAFNDVRLDKDNPAESFEQTYRVYKKDSSVAWVHEKGTLAEMDGESVYIILLLDISNSKEIEEKLRISEEEMHLAMSNMGKMICLFDPLSRTLTLPEAYASRYDMPAVLADVPYSFAQNKRLSETALKAYTEFYESIINGEKTGVSESCIDHINGQSRWERLEFFSIFDSKDNPIKAIITLEDTTLQHEKDDETAAIRQNERILQMVAAHSNRTIYRYDILSKSIHANVTSVGNQLLPITGTNLPESVIEANVVLPESVDDFRQLFRDIHSGKPDGIAKIHIYDSENNAIWVDMRYSIIEYADGNPVAAALSYADITDIHEQAMAYERYRQSTISNKQNENIAFFEADLTSDIVERMDVNIPDVTFPVCGCTHTEAVNYGVDNMVNEDNREDARKFFSRNHILTAFDNGTGSLTKDLPVTLPDASAHWFKASIQIIRDPYSDHIRAFTILHDITKKKNLELEVKKRAEIDGMTNLYNKSTAEAMIRQRLERADNTPCALLMVDLDNLKLINDNYGHARGDDAICCIASALSAQFRKTDIVGRVGGDEFVAFLDGAGNDEKLQDILMSFMQKLPSVRLGGNNDFAIAASVGIVIGTIGEDTYDELFRKADKALYHVKRNGKNNFAFYSPDMENATPCFEC